MFFADFIARFLLLSFVGNPPGKSPAKSSKMFITKIPKTFLQKGRYDDDDDDDDDDDECDDDDDDECEKDNDDHDDMGCPSGLKATNRQMGEGEGEGERCSERREYSRAQKLHLPY